MIRIISILLTSLLLYHIFRASAVMYFMEKEHTIASAVEEADEWVVVKLPVSLPYATAWEDTSGKNGLIKHGNQFYNIVEQRYQNDTLYTILKTNISAREKFFSIVEEINNLTDQSAEKGSNRKPYTTLIKLLHQLSGSYISSYFKLNQFHLIQYLDTALVSYRTAYFVSPVFPVNTPPPKFS